MRKEEGEEEKIKEYEAENCGTRRREKGRSKNVEKYKTIIIKSHVIREKKTRRE